MQTFRPFGPLVRPGPDHWSVNLPISTFFTETAVISSFLGILIQTQRHSTDNIKGNKKCSSQNGPMTSLRGSKLRSKFKKKFKIFFLAILVILDPNSQNNDIFYFFQQFHEQINLCAPKNRSENTKTVISKIRFWARGDFLRFRRYFGFWWEFLEYLCIFRNQMKK